MSKKVLVAPLDWGLGHATRCIPVINELLIRGIEIVLGVSGHISALYSQEYPGLAQVELPSYRIRYHSRGSLAFALAGQLPGIRSTIREEHEVLGKIIRDYQIGLVISDNRYGLWNDTVPSVFITHQLSIRTFYNDQWFNALLRRYHYSMIKRFDTVWVPDAEGPQNLSGKLSHGIPLPPDTWFVGPLSHFGSLPYDKTTIKEEGLLVILSGPEPQRTHFERLLEFQLSELDNHAVLVRGLPTRPLKIEKTGKLEIYNYLNTIELLDKIRKASLIICRSGYSSLMDLAVLGKKAIFIPTPGQWEQVYLARYHQELGHYYSEPQKCFNLQRAMNVSHTYTGIQWMLPSDGLQSAIKNIIGKL